MAGAAAAGSGGGTARSGAAVTMAALATIPRHSCTEGIGRRASTRSSAFSASAFSAVSCSGVSPRFAAPRCTCCFTVATACWIGAVPYATHTILPAACPTSRAAAAEIRPTPSTASLMR